MNKIVAIILFTTLLLSCKEKQQSKLVVAEEKPEQEQIEENPEVLKAKLKEEYEKKFGVPISDFELSIERVEYYYSYIDYQNYFLKISITRTSTGAIARYMAYKVYEPEFEIKLDIGEWLDFVNALHKYKVKGKKDALKFDYVDVYLTDRQYLNIWLSSQEDLKSFFNEYHLDRAKTTKLMEAMDAKIKKSTAAKIAAKIEPKLKTEYEKKFGVPISDFELSISRMYFQYNKPSSFNIEAIRTTKGVHIIYSDYERGLRYLKLELDINDWLDFINALNRCSINKWEERNFIKDKKRRGGSDWLLNIYFLDEHLLVHNIEEYLLDQNKLAYRGFGYPPNWDEFMKVIDDFRAKIIEKAGVK